jgi:CHAT domain-containing protein
VKPRILTTAVVASGFLVLYASEPGSGRRAGAEAPGEVEAPHQTSYADKEERARRQVAQAEEARPPSEEAIADALDALVEVLWENGRGAERESQEIAAQAVALRARLNGPDDLKSAVSLRNQGKLLIVAGDYQAARGILERVLAMRKRGLPPDDPLVAQSLGDLGGALTLTADYAGARALFEQSIAIYRHVEPGGVSFSKQLANLAVVRQQLGDVAGAAALLQEAIEIRDKARVPDDPGLAYLLLLLADSKFFQGDATAARPIYERALALEKDSLPPTHYIVGMTLRGLGGVHLQQKDYKESRRYFERSLAIQTLGFGPEHPLIASISTGLAFARLGMGDAAGARVILERTLDAQERTIGRRHPETGMTEANLARVLFSVGDYRGALDRALEAESIWRRHFLDTARGLSQEDALRFEPLNHEGLDMGWVVLTRTGSGPPMPADVMRVWDQTIRARAMVLDEMGRRHHAVAEAATPEVAILGDRLDRVSAELARLLDESTGSESAGDHARHLALAYEERKRVVNELAKSSAAFRRDERRTEAGFEEIVRALPEGSAMLAYVEYDPTALSTALEPLPPSALAYLAVVLAPGSREPSLIPLGPAQAIEAAVRRWRDEAGTDPRAGGVRAAEERYADAGRRLRELVWDPVAEKVRGAATLFVVPDGALQLVNLGTLPVRDGGYLIETGPLLHILSSERDLVRDAVAPDPGGSLLTLGGVDFDARTAVSSLAVGAAEATSLPACAGLRPTHYRPLPGSDAEARAIARIWRARVAGAGDKAGDAILLTGSAADEVTFKREAPRHAVLHIATHGFFVEGSCAPENATPGGAHIRIVPREAMPGIQPFEGDPFARSGLALAGANRRVDPGVGPDARANDGILTAEEIAALDLSRVRWAVLSGCNTGVGEVLSGEGVLGLRRAFAIAGAASLIMSLWPVEDEATGIWMQRLYEARGHGLTTAESVRRADLDVLGRQRHQGRTAHPFFWGAFVATGDWR